MDHGTIVLVCVLIHIVGGVVIRIVGDVDRQVFTGFFLLVTRTSLSTNVFVLAGGFLHIPSPVWKR